MISMLKIRRPLGRLIFNMGIAIPGNTVFLIETAPWPLGKCICDNWCHILYFFVHGWSMVQSYWLLLSINSERSQLISIIFPLPTVASNLRSTTSIPSDIPAICSFHGFQYSFTPVRVWRASNELFLLTIGIGWMGNIPLTQILCSTDWYSDWSQIYDLIPYKICDHMYVYECACVYVHVFLCAFVCACAYIFICVSAYVEYLPLFDCTHIHNDKPQLHPRWISKLQIAKWWNDV